MSRDGKVMSVAKKSADRQTDDGFSSLYSRKKILDTNNLNFLLKQSVYCATLIKYLMLLLLQYENFN